MTTLAPQIRPTFVLASSSKYRLAQLQERFNLEIQAISPDIDESPEPGESIADTAARLSFLKALAVLPKAPQNSIVIAGDQTAELEGELLKKPGSHERAREQLSRFSGKSIRFYSGVSVLKKDDDSNTTSYRQNWQNQSLAQLKTHTKVVVTTVRFKELSAEQIEHYLLADTPYDCVGAFKNERLGIALFSSIESQDPSALTGLPLIATCELLEQQGVDLLLP